MTRLVVWPAVAASAVVAAWLINRVLFPSSVVPIRHVVWTVLGVALVAYAVTLRQRRRA